MSLAAILELHGARAVVVGGGRVAARRARTLLDAGMDVQIIAPSVKPEVRGLPVTCAERGYDAGDLAGAALVVAATDDAQVNDSVTAEARSLGIPVNHAGHAERGTLRFPAVARRGGVQVAITTGRELPMLAQALAELITPLLPDAAHLDAWTQRRDAALTVDSEARATALAGLRDDIRAHLGLPGTAQTGSGT
ncbi:bifunctional precorrin-2 dehydrogenase/sirohydrochlorin ferrochelatase [Deinococcus yunweiensis]|uniref:precorrin-2 dehydrogenase/sirohydrochlorin ferrochelatase family protein n=1 Tax=Deinococcus yunweiensis TaxID=367282 RepID=UPI00398EC1B0